MFIVPHKERFCSFEPFPSASLLSSHDHLVKMWDQRSHKTPLFELTGAIIGHNAEQSDIAQRRPSSNGFLSYFHHATKRWKTKQSLLTIRRESCHHNRKPNTRSTGHSDKVLCCDWSNSEVFWNALFCLWMVVTLSTQVIASGAADNDMKVFKASTSEALKIDES